MIPVFTGDLLTIVAGTFALLVVPQFALTLWFVKIVRRRTREFLGRNASRPASATVPAEVILCLRGCDATLEDVFSALARQSHRVWRLRVVVDSVEDPAWPVARAAMARLEAD